MNLKNFVLPCVLILFSVVGCSRQLKPDGFPPLYPVSVLVIQDGKPLGGALVSLHGTENSPLKWGVFAETDSNGKAVFVTHGKFYGAPEGEYLITVAKEELVEVANRGGNGATDSFTLIEKQYTDREQTPYRIHIQKKSKNHVELDVGKPVREFLGRNVA